MLGLQQVRPLGRRCNLSSSFWRSSSKGRGKKGRSASSAKGSGKAYFVSEAKPLFFSLGADDEQEEQFCNMVRDTDGEKDMDQDAGDTYLDKRRKEAKADPESDSSAWEAVAPPYPMASSSAVPEEFAPFVPRRDAQKPKEKDQHIIVSVPADKIKKIHVKSLALARPAGVEEMRVRELQADCDRWGIAVSGSKSEILLRLRRLYGGEMVLQKGCTTRYVQLTPEPLSTAAAPTRSRTSATSAARTPPQHRRLPAPRRRRHRRAECL